MRMEHAGHKDKRAAETWVSRPSPPQRDIPHARAFRPPTEKTTKIQIN